MIQVTFDRASVSTGEFVTGTVSWKSDDARTSGEILIAAEWQTSGEGNIARGTARSTRATLQRGARQAEIPFRFMIPFEGPVSFETELITMKWLIRVRVVRSGFDETVEAFFRVEPRRRQRRVTGVEEVA